MTKCKYQHKTIFEKYQCDRKTEACGICILHEELTPENTNKKMEIFNKEINEGKTNFTGCILPQINLKNKTIEG